MAGSSEAPSSPPSSPDADATAQKTDLQRLEAEIQAAKSAYKPDSARLPQGMELGMRMAFDLLGGVAVGGYVGWQLDLWLQTSPWLMILCLLFGLAAGITAMVRLAQRAG